MRHKIDSIIVSPNEKYVVWDVDLTDIERDTKLTVSSGCIAYYLVNGALKSQNTMGQWKIKSKEEDKQNANLRLVAANMEKMFEVYCGVGNIPFKDDEINYETTVGAYGTCKLKLASAWSLFNKLGHSNITVEEIDSEIKSKLTEIMSTQLASVLQHYDYQTIKTQLTTIANDLKKKFTENIIELGMNVEVFALEGITFSEEYIQKRQEFFEEQNQRERDKEDRRAREREQRIEVENVTATLNALRDFNVDEKPQPTTVNNYYGSTSQNRPAPEQPEKQFCPNCGKEVKKGSKFCVHCGTKLN